MTHSVQPDSQYPGGADALIQVRNLRKRHGRKAILKGVDLDVRSGEVVALLGANGAGKTTLIRMVAGLSRADRGEIQLGGVLQERAGHELRRYVGMVAHAPLLYDNLTGWENLHFFANLYDMTEPAQRIEVLLHEVDLWSRRRDRVRTYSRGMIQRLAIARSLLHDPPVLLLDEPDTGLDQRSMEMLHQLIHQLGTAQRAVLLSTHNLEQALAWANRVCILADGQIVHTQATKELTVEHLREVYRKSQ